MKKRSLKLSALILALTFIASTTVCFAQGKYAKISQTDYSKKANWARLPKKTDKEFDVFFVHPTTYMTMEDGYNASLDNKKVNKATDETIQRQASVFEKTCNIFAPRYHQSSIKVLSEDEKTRDKYLDIALKDVHDAFAYYMVHLNNDRPIVIASHSQGSNLMLKLLKKYSSMIKKRQIVVIYMIGWTVTPEDLKKIKMPLATTPEMTGGIIVWNTIGKNGKSPVLVSPDALCINPLTWTDDKKEQPASKNIYAKILLKDSSTVKIPHFTSARIGKNGGLIIPTPKIINKLRMGMGPEVYHGYDYDFFYGNLVENVATRCKAFKNKFFVVSEEKVSK